MCDGYENSTGKKGSDGLDSYWSAFQMAHMIAKMKYLDEYTDYKRRLDEECNLTGEFTHPVERGNGLTPSFLLFYFSLSS